MVEKRPAGSLRSRGISETPAVRPWYNHGNLKRGLLLAGCAMARSLFRLGLAVALVGLSCWSGIAAEKAASQLFPPSVVAYVEVPKPGKLIDGVLDHPLA